MPIRETRYRVTLTIKEPLLGAVPRNREIYTDYVLSKAPDQDAAADEIDTVEQVEGRGWTGFHLDEDARPFLYDYVIKGFFKDVCKMLRRATGTESKKVSAYKQVIDGTVFIEPRQILLELPDELPPNPFVGLFDERPNPHYDPDERDPKSERFQEFVLVRTGSQPMPDTLPAMEHALRASTPQGERVALAKSDYAPVGTRITFEVILLAANQVTEALLTEWFDYGWYRGLGQWRNASWGSFTYHMERVEAEA